MEQDPVGSLQYSCLKMRRAHVVVQVQGGPARWLARVESLRYLFIRDAERLQGFDADWTAPAEEVSTRGCRWRLVGNAVTTAVSEWLGLALRSSSSRAAPDARELDPQSAWPKAAFGEKGKRHAALVSMWPVMRAIARIDTFLQFPCRPLSRKATAGFYSRLMASDPSLSPTIRS
jgi:DNA (cytosine-5)-methyltransferase 1